MKCIAQKQARYLQGACFSQCSRDIRGSRGPTWRSTSMCFAISYHIHLFWFCFPKQTSAPCGSQWVKRRRSMHTTASTLLQLRSTSACYLCCCVRSLDTMQVQVQTHMHAHIWSGFVPAVHLEAFFFHMVLVKEFSLSRRTGFKHKYRLHLSTNECCGAFTSPYFLCSCCFVVKLVRNL